MGKGRCRTKAQGHRGERSLSLPGEARIGQGARRGGVLPRISLRGLRRSMGQGTCRAKAQRHRRECSLSLMGKALVGPGAGSPLGWGPAQIQPALPEARKAARASPGQSRATQGRAQPLPTWRSPGRAGSPLGCGQGQIQPARSKTRQATRASPGRSRATQEREQPLPAGQSPGRAGSPLGWDPAETQPARPKQLQAAWASPGSRAKQGWFSLPRPRAKPGSVQGREPTRVGSCPGSACAAEGAPGCKGVAGPKPSVAGGGPCRAGSLPGGSRPDSAFTAEGAQCCMGVARPKLSDAGESAASPSWAKPVSGREPTRVGSGLRC